MMFLLHTLMRNLKKLSDHGLPILVVGILLVLVWDPVAIWVNSPAAERLLERGTADCQTVIECARQLRNPIVPSLGQLGRGLANMALPLGSTSTVGYNALITAAETLVGLGLALVVGFVSAVALVFSRAFERMMLPWIVASQNVPIVALAPVLAVLLGQYGVQGWLPKAIVAAYIAFFPLSVGIAKGLSSVPPLQLDLMRTYHAHPLQVFYLLRIPAALPMLFTSLKISAAMALVGAIVAEISIVSFSGLGPMLLSRSYYSDMVGLWVIMLVAAALGILLVQGIGLLEKGLMGWQNRP
ncbi:ABC transporter permease [Thermostichus vulcanus]|uniref:ABC transporter permease n=1 Tax=Thermostichus vulcanus str. 'Rupite' TaxID=2813851 RepID=A0ABT0CAA6_THEVL|nr:ABC transporter permease [Thermostichus vulcanus]MCJ2542717.1 ABC transporter permease [Thermostichus vulcanus str. 'Rupite']